MTNPLIQLAEEFEEAAQRAGPKSLAREAAALAFNYCARRARELAGEGERGAALIAADALKWTEPTQEQRAQLVAALEAYVNGGTEEELFQAALDAGFEMTPPYDPNWLAD